MSPTAVAEALGAVAGTLREQLASNGGRPSLVTTTRLQRVPMCEDNWQRLREIAAAVAGEGFHPTPGQVASVLLSRALAGAANRSEKDCIRASIRAGQQVALRQARDLIERGSTR